MDFKFSKTYQDYGRDVVDIEMTCSRCGSEISHYRIPTTAPYANYSSAQMAAWLCTPCEIKANKPATVDIDKILCAARLRESRNGNSSYIKIGRFTVRVSDHARQSHHSSCWNFSEPDIHVLILNKWDAENFEKWRKENPREVSAAAVVIRKPRERATTTARKLRSTIAREIFAIRTENGN